MILSLPRHAHRHGERGNMLFMILIAIVLIGLLTAVIMNSGGSESANIDDETLVVRATEVRRQVSEFERAAMFVMANGKSENDLRFAHPGANADYGDLSADADPSDQVFHPEGGAASYREPPEDINDGSAWEFYGGTALPGVGSDRADLVAVLPNVTQQFCDKINTINGQDAPQDTGGSLASGVSAGDCVNMGAAGRFGDTNRFYISPNTADASSFAEDPEISAVRPAPEACVRCAADSKSHFYHVLIAR